MEIANDISRSDEVATKADLQTALAKLETEMYCMNNRTIMWVVAVGLAVVGIIKYL